MVCPLLTAQYLITGKYLTAAAIANRLLSVDGCPIGPKQKWPPLTAENAPRVTGSADIPLELLPVMIVLDDPSNPSSAHLFDPEHLERTLGQGARFLSAQIAIERHGAVDITLRSLSRCDTPSRDGTRAR
jgi:hypothetical protein